MELIMLIFAVSMAVIALLVYIELKSTQQRLDGVKRDLERRVTETLDGFVRQASTQIPEIERRVESIERNLEEVRHAVEQSDDRGQASQDPQDTRAAA